MKYNLFLCCLILVQPIVAQRMRCQVFNLQFVN